MEEKEQHGLQRVKSLLAPWLHVRRKAQPAPEAKSGSDGPRMDVSPIFIGGTGRSGTTAFARMLGLHPDIFVLRWETQLIVAPGGLLELLPSLHQPDKLEAFKEALRGRWFRRTINRGLPNEYSAGLCDDLTAEEIEDALRVLDAGLRPSQSMPERLALAASFLDALFRPATKRADALRWAEKTPRNILFMDQLLAVFPRMKLINVIRDGRDVVSSMLQHGFWPVASTPEYPETLRFCGEMSFEKAVDYWVAWMKIAHEKAAEMPPGSYLEIRLEDLVAEPRTTLEQVLDFVGTPFHEAPLAYDLGRSHIGRWKKDLTPDQAEKTLGTAGPMLEKCGYL